MTVLKHIKDMPVSEFRKQAKAIIDEAKDEGYIIHHKMSKAEVCNNSITNRVKKHKLPHMADVQKIKGLLKEIADMYSEVINNCNSIVGAFFENIIESRKFIDSWLVSCDITIDLLLAANA